MPENIDWRDLKPGMKVQDDFNNIYIVTDEKVPMEGIYYGVCNVHTGWLGNIFDLHAREIKILKT